MNPHHYVILPRLEIAGANAQPVPWLVAPPAMTAYHGFAHALALALGASAHAGFSVIHHDIEYHGDVIGGALHPHQQRGAQLIDHRDYASSTPHILASQPTARCRVTASLIVRFDAEVALAEQKIERFLRGARVAGGAIVDHGYSARDETLVRPRTFYSSEITARLGTGFAIHERADLLEMRPGDKDRLDPFLRAITRPFPSRKRTEQDPVDANKWIVPTALGYAGITPLANRKQVRQGLPHAFAEALVGLVEYKPLRQAEPVFWTPRWPAPDVYVVSTSPSDTLENWRSHR